MILKLPCNGEELLAWATYQLQQTPNLFYGHGTVNAEDEAYACVLHALALPLDVPPLLSEVAVNESQLNKVQQLIDTRISEQKPLPYLLHEAWFAGLPFYVDERVLIPKSPLAELIQQGFEPWLGGRPVNHILDLATGSGCIAIACAHVFEKAQIDASDISADALLIAKKNVMQYNLIERIYLHQTDLFNGMVEHTYDIIISNPPYVAQSEIDQLPIEYQHEPELALAGGGHDGLDLVARMIQQAKTYLAPQGLLIVEVGDRKTELNARFPTLPFIWHEFAAGGEGVFILEQKELP